MSIARLTAIAASTVLAVGLTTAAGTAAADTTPAAPRKGPAAMKTVKLNDARIAVPRGWKATRSSWGPAEALCLHPKGTKTCDIKVTDGTNLWMPSGPQVMADVPGGYPADPRWCDDETRTITAGGTRTWGGRSAEFRRWDVQCGAQDGPTVVQYVAPHKTVFTMYAETTRAKSADVTNTMHAIAKASRLPAATRPVRLYDQGIVRSVQAVPGGHEVSIDRIAAGWDGYLNPTPTTYSYVIPADARWGQPMAEIGDRVWLYSDGYTVEGFTTVE